MEKQTIAIEKQIIVTLNKTTIGRVPYNCCMDTNMWRHLLFIYRSIALLESTFLSESHIRSMIIKNDKFTCLNCYRQDLTIISYILVLSLQIPCTDVIFCKVLYIYEINIGGK